MAVREEKNTMSGTVSHEREGEERKGCVCHFVSLYANPTVG